jgi:D-ornithine 4,5-aminomutase subunit alpha
MKERKDDFDARREHLKTLSDGQLNDRFWSLADRMVQALVAEARTHTSPSIERSVLMRMGFSSLETKPLVNRMLEKGVLGQGAGHLVLRLAQKNGISVRQAGLGLIEGKYWEELTV